MGPNRGLVCLVLVSISLLSVSLEPTVAQRRISTSVGKSLQDFDFLQDLGVEFPAPGPGASPESSLGAQLRFFVWGRAFYLRLERASLFSADSRTVWLDELGREVEDAPENVFFTGIVEGEPSSSVRLTVLGSNLEGIIVTQEEVYFLEPARRYFPGAKRDQILSYRFSDLEGLWQNYQCAAGDSPTASEFQTPPSDNNPWQADSVYQSLLDGATSLAVKGPPREVRLGLVVDSYYYQQHGAGSAIRVQSIIHQMNPIYESQLGLTFRITETRVSTSSSQDFLSSTSDVGDLLRESSTSQMVAGNDLVHLFTGRNLDGSAVGIARGGGICHESQAIGISQDLSSAKLRIVLAAHEIGHNVGALHDGEGFCSDAEEGYIMWPFLEAQAIGFSQCSAASISRRLGRAQCLEGLPGQPLPAPVAVAPEGSVSTRQPAFQWQPVEGVQAYHIEIREETNDSTVVSENVVGTAYHAVESLRRLSAYRWRVAALEGEVAGEQSPWLSFQVERLASPVPLTPHGVIQTLQPGFSWQQVEGAESYRLELFDEKTGTIVLMGDLSETLFHLAEPLTASRYRWRVSSQDGGLAGHSPWVRFAIRPPRHASGPRDRP